MKKEKNFSEMTELELRDFAQETRSKMKDILDLVTSEKRKELTEDEEKEHERLEKQLELAERYQVAMQRSIPLVQQKKETEEPEVRKVHDVFGENLRTAVKAGEKIRLELRADEDPIFSTDVKDTVPVLFKDVIEALTPALVTEKIGVRMQFGVQGQPVWPTVGDVEASWEGEAVALEDKTIDFGKIKAVPHRMGLSISITQRALNQSNLQLYNIIVSKIARSFAALINKTLLSFTKVASDAPNGVFITAAADPVGLKTHPTLRQVVSLETKVMNANIELDADGFGAYIVSTAMRGKLKTTPIEPGSPKMLLEGDTMNGYPVITSNYMASDSIGFGFFEYAVISQFGDMRFLFDPYTGAKEDKVTFVGNTEVDITQLRAEAFAVGTIDPDLDDEDDEVIP